MLNPRNRLNWSLLFFVFLAFFGALIWAKSDDPFRRVEFALKVPSHGRVKGIVVLQKPVRSCPVVVYLHGSGESILTSGNELRQFAELGLAAVCLEYDQANQADFAGQLLALSGYLRKQPWAMTNAIAWVGSSLGAQRMLSFALAHPEFQPQLMVRLSGGWLPELDSQPSSILNPPSSPLLRCPVLLVHGEKDYSFPAQDVKRLAGLLRARGTLVTEKLLPDRGHGFQPDRALVTRLVAEYCQSALTPEQPFKGVAERRTVPFWVCMLPALGWAGFCFYQWRKARRPKEPITWTPLNKWEKGLRWLAVVLATLAAVETAVHLLTPQFATSERTLDIAKRYLIAPKWTEDFNYLSTNAVWLGKPLKVLLEHVELAHYNRNELINWKVDETIYRKFVLSPNIDASSETELNWRRPLWESFYPRIRKEDTPEAAAQIVIRFLRERVTMDPKHEHPPGIETAWRREITDEKGFEIIYVAALRSVGVGARLNPAGKAEFWTGKAWANAPRPIASSFL